MISADFCKIVDLFYHHLTFHFLPVSFGQLINETVELVLYDFRKLSVDKPQLWDDIYTFFTFTAWRMFVFFAGSLLMLQLVGISASILTFHMINGFQVFRIFNAY